MSKKFLFKGAATAVVTPFTDSGEVNYKELTRILEFQINEGIDAIVLCGTTGEAPTLSDTEHQRMISHAAEVINKRVPLICGTGSNDTAHAVMMSKSAVANGADGLLLVTPYYNRANSKGLIKSFSSIADSADIPMIIYNVPSRTTVDIPIEVYRALSSHPNIVGIKEAGGSIGKFARLVYEMGDKYYVYTGNDDNLISTLAVGGMGVISVTSNIIPGYLHEICDNWFKKEYDTAYRMHIKLCELNSLLFSDINPIPVKAAMRMLGYNCGAPRLPLVEMSDEGQRLLKNELKRLNII
ncbi:MAG: 4-hydroxy-tetrahydrodipicolinate synthase [Ruminococcaceae bacterium]|nr:4-hydroxy-tetrahydrodipicolinate synthase [Oscillospiraceae bacterium]MBE6965065.1 4-hydroxy-tetrahydrodipicolinate synthase [Oscillospiraceae bacterium]